MTNLILLCSVVLILCVFVYKFFSKFGVPMLLVFMSIGMIFGENGIFKITYNNFALSKEICNFALIFIIFFGGFGTKISTAKGIIKKAITLATIGVFLTAFLTAIFAHYILGMNWQTSLLLGAVLGSTDAASVFSILRSYRLSLKEKTAPLLEIESGSNDPFAYVLTISFLSLSGGTFNLPILLLRQVILGIAIGYGFSKITAYALTKIKNLDIGFAMALIMGNVLFSYSFSEFTGGNGLIAVYLFGILLGNSNFKGRIEIVSFFNGITSVMQMLIFFLLGLLVNPASAIRYIVPAVAVMLTMTFIIRPAVIFTLLAPFKSSRGQKLLVSWAGLRGAASVVFSIFVVTDNMTLGYPIFNITYIVVFLSIALQGSLIPYMSKKLDMIDENEDILKTFNDYSDEEDVDFITSEIDENHKWVGKKIRDIDLMPSVLLVLIIRDDKNIIPNGDTIIENKDKIVLCGSSFVEKNSRIRLYENVVDKNSAYYNKYIRDLDKNNFVVMIKREGSTMIPKGDTVLYENDILVMLDR